MGDFPYSEFLSNPSTDQLNAWRQHRQRFAGKGLGVCKDVNAKSIVYDKYFDLSTVHFANGSVFSDCTFEEVNFSGAVFEDVCFLGRCVFRKCQLTNTKFIQPIFEHVSFEGVWTGANLEVKSDGKRDQRIEAVNCHFANSRFHNVRMPHTKFIGGNLAQSEFKSSDLTDSVLDTTAPGIKFDGAILRNARLQGDYRGAQFNHVNGERSNLAHSDLRNAQFDNGTFARASFVGCRFNRGTRFTKVEMEEARVYRFTLECLDSYGDLTPGDRMEMQIIDDPARLRSEYSGFLQWIHITALATFLFPYAWFVASRWTRARFGNDDGDNTTTLLAALARFIWSGGTDWRGECRLNVLSFTLFVYSLGYNVVRGFLLWKTKKLELYEQASGLPPMFILEGTWGRLYEVAKVGFFVNIFVVIVHTFRFMLQRIPL